MAQINVILWDVDGTLLDFSAAERRALEDCFRSFQMGPCTPELLARYSQINRTYWRRLERGELTKPQVLLGRFEEFFAQEGLNCRDIPAFNQEYQLRLGDTVVFRDDAGSLVARLKGRVRQYAVTNGTRVAQERKLSRSGLDRMLDGVFISEIVGTEKPGAAFFDAVFSACRAAVSVKTRLGVRDPAEFDRLLAVYNRYPIAELTIHPRVREDFYRGGVREAAFAAALPQCRMPVCYNGDVVSEADAAAVGARYPAVRAVMIGRGLVGDPSLVTRLRGGPRADKDVLEAFHNTLYERYCAAFGDRRIAMLRMKEVWFYHLNLFADSEKYGKRLRKAAGPDDFLAAAAAVFRDLPLREQVEPDWFR